MKRTTTLFAALLVMLGLGFMAVPAFATGDDSDKCYETVVIKEAWTELKEHPAETKQETVTIVVEEAVPAKPGQHYSWNGGNRGVNDPPSVVPPHEDWQLQGVGFDPHLQGGGDPATWYPTDPATSGLHVLGNSPVNASWFYYVPGTEAKPAVTRDEVRTVVVKEAWTEEINHPAVTEQREVECDDKEPKPPVTPEEPEQPEPPKPDVKPDQVVVVDQPRREVRAVPAAVPTAVAAGLPATGSDAGMLVYGLGGSAFVGAGALLLLAARRQRGVHQA